MKITMVHDATFHENNGKYYCNQIDYNMLKDFLYYFDYAHIVVREGEMKQEYVELDFNNISIEFTKRITRPLSFLLYFFQTIMTIRENVILGDVIYCRGINGIIAQIWSKYYRKVDLLFIGSCIYDSMKSIGKVSYSTLAFFVKKIMQKSTKKATNVIYVSQYLVERYPTNGNVFLWTEVKIVNPGDKVRTIRKDKILNFKKAKSINIGLIGYVNNKVKGIEVAIKAVSLLDSKYTLNILGGGDYSHLEKLIRNNNLEHRVVFHGTLSGGDQVFKWLDQIDIYIQPSLTEGLPKATLEAQSRGCPVIASKVGGLPDIVMEEYLHEPNNHVSLAQLIKKLSSSETKMNYNAFHSFDISKKFTEEVMCNTFNKIMANVISQV